LQLIVCIDRSIGFSLSTVMKITFVCTLSHTLSTLSHAHALILPLFTGKSAIITNTATATLRQVVSLLFDRVSLADQVDGDDPVSVLSTPTMAAAAAHTGLSSASAKPSRLVRRSKAATHSCSFPASGSSSATPMRTPRVPSTSSAAAAGGDASSTVYVESIPAWDVQALLQSLNPSARCSWLLLHDLCLLCSSSFVVFFFLLRNPPSFESL
jgi:hypothetical protein